VRQSLPGQRQQIEREETAITTMERQISGTARFKTLSQFCFEQ
jgi:hypothetical protein